MTTETQRVVYLSRELTGEAFDVVAAFIGDLTKDVADKTFVETDAPIKVRRERVAAARNPSIRPEMSNAVERARRFTDDIAAAGGWQGNWEMIITPTGSHWRRPDDPIKTLCRIELYMTHRRTSEKRFTGRIALEATKVDGSGDDPLESAGLGVSKEGSFVADNLSDTASTLTGQACSPASGREDESRSGDVASPESVISSHVHLTCQSQHEPSVSALVSDKDSCASGWLLRGPNTIRRGTEGTPVELCAGLHRVLIDWSTEELSQKDDGSFVIGHKTF